MSMFFSTFLFKPHDSLEAARKFVKSTPDFGGRKTGFVSWQGSEEKLKERMKM